MVELGSAPGDFGIEGFFADAKAGGFGVTDAVVVGGGELGEAGEGCGVVGALERCSVGVLERGWGGGVSGWLMVWELDEGWRMRDGLGWGLQVAGCRLQVRRDLGNACFVFRVA